ncbi:MBL fold metallo-hydrolase [Nitrogeniibacter mangrovi]|uniref:MBL fold metallo-hydrolase n=1 Tax=Nitrogeniibacter mangrovi TaxID=2016596 RepID=A0A6C1B9T3_9RHOO|nr:MBL fold metallo-hydrolase [Nitrogeniibacter mangrovi]QID19024.1 MBL fold metallo-hydrolase [Nitrogeniibacter mangrovi]
MQSVITYPEGIYAIESGYERPQLAAIHAIVSGDAVAIVDSGNNESVPRVLEALASLGFGPEQVRYVLLTHIHLDHAGGAGALMAACPNAALVVHPRGVRHMVDPSKLWAGTVAVYGEDDAIAKYGRIQSVAAERIVEATDGRVVDLNGRKIRVAETPGHALHHVCYFDEQTRAWFTGDTFGLSYRELDHDGRAFVFPTTTPVQFDPDALHASIDRLMAEQPTAMYLTHYSRVTDLPRLASDLHRLIDAHVAIARSGANAVDRRHQIIRAGLSALMRQEAARQQWPISENDLFELFAMDLELNAQGLEVWLDRQAAA